MQIPTMGTFPGNLSQDCVDSREAAGERGEIERLKTCVGGGAVRQADDRSSQKPSELVKRGKQCYILLLVKTRCTYCLHGIKEEIGSLHFSCKWMIVFLELIWCFSVSLEA